MSRKRKLAGTLAGVVLLALVSATSATATTWRWSRGEITITGEILFGELTRCKITLRGNMTTEPFSTRGPVASIGSITGAEARECTGAVIRFLVEAGRPWSVTYDSFSGTLPDRVTGIRVWIEEATFLLERVAGGNSCLYTTRLGQLLNTEFVRETLWEYTQAGNSINGENEIFRSIVTLAGTCPTRVLMPAIGRGTEARLQLSGLVISPSPVEFGRVATESLTRRSVSFTTGSATTIRAIRVRNGTYVAITDPNRCVGSALGAGGRCSFNVIFVGPGEAGRAVEDTVSIEATSTNLDVVVRGTT